MFSVHDLFALFSMTNKSCQNSDAGLLPSEFRFRSAAVRIPFPVCCRQNSGGALIHRNFAGLLPGFSILCFCDA